MRSFRNKKGFSLIELLVGCVIVAVLATVSIPLYIGYVNAQRQTNVSNLAETAAASANAYFRRTGLEPANGAVIKNAAPLYLYFDSTSYTVSVTASSNTITVTDRHKTTIKGTATY